MTFLVYFLSVLSLLATGLPIVRFKQWWIWIFYFPRTAIAICWFVSFLLCIRFFTLNWRSNLKPVLPAYLRKYLPKVRKKNLICFKMESDIQSHVVLHPLWTHFSETQVIAWEGTDYAGSLTTLKKNLE